MSEIVLLGINHLTAPLEIRERLAIPPARLADATRSLAAVHGIRESLILSTCNRVELLTVQDHQPNLLEFIHQYFAVAPATLRPHLYEYRDREAVRHLFRVAASLDSMVVGEPQILGQVKQSYTIAKEVGAAQNSLDRLLQSAFSVAKKVRTETEIGSSSVSIASVAVDLARKIFGSLAGKTVLLVGAGKCQSSPFATLSSTAPPTSSSPTAPRSAPSASPTPSQQAKPAPKPSRSTNSPPRPTAPTSSSPLPVPANPSLPRRPPAKSSHAAAAAPSSSSISPSPAT